MRYVVIAVVLLAGCVAPSFRELPEREQNRFGRCFEKVRPQACGSVDSDSCYRAASGQYGDRPTEDARKEWLIAYGCPPAMVEAEL